MTKKKKFQKRAYIEAPLAMNSFVKEWLFSRNRNQEPDKISLMWQNWDLVMGEMLKQIAYPLGCRDKILIIGASDNMVLQELSFMTFEILERVSAFMEEDFFEKVELTLLLDKTPINIPQSFSAPKMSSYVPECPQDLGSLDDLKKRNDSIGLAVSAYIYFMKGINQ